MRTLQLIRLYALAVFFLVVVGGIVLRPGAPGAPHVQAQGNPAPPVTAAGIAP